MREKHIREERKNMLRLIIGRAGSGKTAAVLSEIAEAVRTGRDGSLLIVPEQYSHEAERELCARCGDSLSLYAEVCSFSSLARSVLSQQGGLAVPLLDRGGKLLCMTLALSRVGAGLKHYSTAKNRAELATLLLGTAEECKTADIGAAELAGAAGGAKGILREKLRDLALILESYDAIVANGHADPSDRLGLLAKKTAESGLPGIRHVYIDGFIDFTAQEHGVIAALLKAGTDMTVCLTLDELQGSNEIFSLSRRAAGRLIACAKDCGLEIRVDTTDRKSEEDVLRLFPDRLFSRPGETLPGGTGRVFLYSTPGMQAECELAAARAIELARDEHCRWRDIAVAVRGFDEYRVALSSAFESAGVPLFTASKSRMLAKPLPSLIASAYEIVMGGWDPDDLADYMRTGLTGLTSEECDELENYICGMQLRASAWERRSDWRRSPDMSGAKFKGENEEVLERLNALRRRLSEPLLRFAAAARTAGTAAGQVAALDGLLEDLDLAGTLSRRSEALRAMGRADEAAETQQLWDITVSAMEQTAAILNDTEMDMAEFGRLFTRMLSSYEIGIIPVSLDAVSAGDFDRMRRRHIRHLIVIGASDRRLPAPEQTGGVFSPAEREELLGLGLDLGGAGDDLWREYALIYHCLSLPSETLMMSYPLVSDEDGAQEPSFVMERAKQIFSLPILPVDMKEVRAASPAGALLLASGADDDPQTRSARIWLKEKAPERLETLREIALQKRGCLSGKSVRALYGSTLRLSASRIDRYASCKFAYFCRYGLGAEPFEPSSLRPNEVGTFIHFVLEYTLRAVMAEGGFSSVDDARIETLAKEAIAEYTHRDLQDLAERNERFVYLFARLCRDAVRIALDVAGELRASAFEPMDFELDFSKLPPLKDKEGNDIRLTGLVDRIDGWRDGEGKKYIRVADYKTGPKTFSLEEVWYGTGLQMLLYLFTLSDHAEELFGEKAESAGVVYVPAKTPFVSVDDETDTDAIEKERRDEERRRGLVLDKEDVIKAWETGNEKRYLPRSGRTGAPASASEERMKLLSTHVARTVRDMAAELRRGTISADPTVRSGEKKACERCDYAEVCLFSERGGEDSARYQPRLSNEEVWAKLEGGENA